MKFKRRKNRFFHRNTNTSAIKIKLTYFAILNGRGRTLDGELGYHCRLELHINMQTYMKLYFKILFYRFSVLSAMTVYCKMT